MIDFVAMLFAAIDGSGDAVTGMLRSGKAGANAAVDHVAVLDAALAQLADET